MRNLFLTSHKQTSHALQQKRARTYVQSKGMDMLLLGGAVFLVLFGLLMVYDASQFEAFQEFGDKFYFFRQQVISAVLGIGVLGFCTFFDYHRFQKLAWPAFLSAFLLLLMVYLPGFGVSAGGAHRWLKIAGLTLQPAEIIKLASVIFFANLFQKKATPGIFMGIVTLVAVVVGILQKDLGTAVVFVLTSFSIYYAAEAPIKYFLGILAVGFLGIVGFIISAPYRVKRILAFLDPFSDPQGYSYHISQVLIALGSGGLFGVGIGQSRQKFAYIPEVTTDSIFSVVGEEFGLIGGIILIALIGFIVSRGFKIAVNAPDRFGRLLALGLIMWLGVQSAVNLAAMVSLIPLTGVPLPFVSYGGSALLANLAAVGILLNISKSAD